MANTLTVQDIINGSSTLVVKVSIVGDGSGEESATLLLDASAYGCSGFTLVKMCAQLVGFSAQLLWDATTDVHLISISEYDADCDFTEVGGIPSNAGTGATGDINITTTGLGAADNGHIALHLKKN